MGFDELFESDRKHYKHGHDHHHESNDYYAQSRSHHSDYDFRRVYFEKIQNNPKLKLLLVIAAIVAVGVVVLICILIFPLILKLFRFVSENGIQGLIDVIWKGTK